jgi:hypothetical protein
MTSMIERVAKAIDEASQPPGQKDYKILMENCARAAIEAMRELPEEPGPRYTAGEYSRRSHEAMIDDALARG